MTEADDNEDYDEEPSELERLMALPATVLSVDEFVRRGLLDFPSLFKTKADVLAHGLLVIGNGYEWHDGGLQSVYGQADGRRYDGRPTRSEEAYKEFLKHSPRGHDFMWQMLIEHYVGDLEVAQLVASQIEARSKDMRLTPHRPFAMEGHKAGTKKGPGTGKAYVYPQSGYALIMRMPSDVRPDWREACEAMWKVALVHDTDPVGERPRWSRDYVDPYPLAL